MHDSPFYQKAPRAVSGSAARCIRNSWSSLSGDSDAFRRPLEMHGECYVAIDTAAAGRA